MEEGQIAIWDSEHRNPFMYPVVAAHVPHPGVRLFWSCFKKGENKRHSSPPAGLEICCGKGRNAIWLHRRGARMSAFDSSGYAIEAAVTRAATTAFHDNLEFRVHDVCQVWPYPDSTFDFVVDCFGSSELISVADIQFVVSEARRVLRSGGFYFLQIDKSHSGYFSSNNVQYIDAHTAVLSNGKIEMLMSSELLRQLFDSWGEVSHKVRSDSALTILGRRAVVEYFQILATK